MYYAVKCLLGSQLEMCHWHNKMATLCRYIRRVFPFLFMYCRYIIHLWDMHHNGPWEHRLVYMHYFEIVLGLAALSVDFLHHLHMIVCSVSSIRSPYEMPVWYSTSCYSGKSLDIKSTSLKWLKYYLTVELFNGNEQKPIYVHRKTVKHRKSEEAGRCTTNKHNYHILMLVCWA